MMNTNLKSQRSGLASREFITSFQGDVCRKSGDMRSEALEGRTINAEDVCGAAAAIRESLDDTFGETAHDFWLKADRLAYELKEDIIDMLRERFQPSLPPEPILSKK